MYYREAARARNFTKMRVCHLLLKKYIYVYNIPEATLFIICDTVKEVHAFSSSSLELRYLGIFSSLSIASFLAKDHSWT